MDKLDIESHPFEPFLPRHAKVLMLGSFPPPRNRWAMEFYYPNKTNDMWRILGIVFFGDKGKFLTTSGYDEAAIRRFASDFGIALYDSAVEIRRGKGNASDKFLEWHIVAAPGLSQCGDDRRKSGRNYCRLDRHESACDERCRMF